MITNMNPSMNLNMNPNMNLGMNQMALYNMGLPPINQNQMAPNQINRMVQNNVNNQMDYSGNNGNFNQPIVEDSLLDGVPYISPPKNMVPLIQIQQTPQPSSQQHSQQFLQQPSQQSLQQNLPQQQVQQSQSQPQSQLITQSQMNQIPLNTQKMNSNISSLLSRKSSISESNLDQMRYSVENKPKPVPSAVLTWEISEERLKKYELYYENFDTNKKNFIANMEAFEIFKQSGLPQDALFNIWSSCDTGAIGFLDKAEFIVAIHLIALGRAGFQISATLPDILHLFLRDYKRKFISKDQLIPAFQQFTNKPQPSPTQKSNFIK